MLHDSMDVGVLAENVRLLQKEIKEAGSELPTPGAGDTGKILKVGSNGYELATEYSYIPPAYSSTEEINTGVKWINGKDIFRKVFTGSFTFPTDTWVNVSELSAEAITKIFVLKDGSYSDFYMARIKEDTGYLQLFSARDASTNGDTVAVEYTKPDPEPTNETKKTKKK